MRWVLPGQWVRPHLELVHLRQRALTALEVPRRAVRRRRPETASLPTRPRIVDAPVDLLHEEADWIRNARDRPAAVLQHQQRVGEIAGGDGHVLPCAERI